MWTCASLFILSILFAVGVGYFTMVQLEGRNDQSIVPLEREETLGLREGEPLVFVNEDGAPMPKPIRVKIYVRGCIFKIKPSNQEGKINLTGDYDEGNFELKTELVERDDHIEYQMRFDSRRPLMFVDDDNGGFPNNLTLFLPKNAPVSLDLDMGIGEGNFDLSGVPLQALDMRVKMGEFRLHSKERNPIQAESFYVKGSMGEMTVEDIQNYNFESGEVNMRMGECRVLNSGRFIRDTNLKVSMKMGEMVLKVPDETSINRDARVVMGQLDAPRPSKGDVTLNLKANVVMADMAIRQGTNKRLVTDILQSIAMEQGADAAIAKYYELQATEQANFKFGAFALERLGYELMEQSQTAEAVKMLEFNIQLFPEYAGSYKALAEAHAMSGNLPAAIAAMEQGLKVNPDWRSGKRLLKKLQQQRDN